MVREQLRGTARAPRGHSQELWRGVDGWGRALATIPFSSSCPSTRRAGPLPNKAQLSLRFLGSPAESSCARLFPSARGTKNNHEPEQTNALGPCRSQAFRPQRWLRIGQTPGNVSGERLLGKGEFGSNPRSHPRPPPGAASRDKRRAARAASSSPPTPSPPGGSRRGPRALGRRRNQRLRS